MVEEDRATLTDTVSSMEKCSFICHLLTLPLGIAYISWVVFEDETLEAWNVTYYPPKAWSMYMPVSALLVFLAAPILYAGFNSMTVPRLDSLDTLHDDYTRKPVFESANRIAQKLAPDATLPEICDLDPAALLWYPRDCGKALKMD